MEKYGNSENSEPQELRKYNVRQIAWNIHSEMVLLSFKPRVFCIVKVVSMKAKFSDLIFFTPDSKVSVHQK